MSEQITVTPSEVWNYYYAHKQDLKTHMHLIASNEDYGVEIYITDENNDPCIVVTADDRQVFSDTAITLKDCGDLATKVYDDYLTDKALDILTTPAEQEEELTEEEAINLRESEIDCAVYNFLTEVLEGYVDLDSRHTDEICDDLKEHFLEYMYRKHDLPIRRPMYLIFDEDGKEVEEFVEFPYEEMEFEDEDNPIYK